MYFLRICGLSAYARVHFISRDVEEQVVTGSVWDHKRLFEREECNCREGLTSFWSDPVLCWITAVTGDNTA